MTDEPGVLLGIQTADCIPVLVADRKQRAVAAFHAGWRGTLARIVENGVGRMRLEFGSRPKDLIASIGPGIGQCCYAVGEEVQQQFESQFTYAAELFREVYDSDQIRNKYPMLFLTARAPGHSAIGPAMHLDLAEANRRQLLAAGVKAVRHLYDRPMYRLPHGSLLLPSHRTGIYRADDERDWHRPWRVSLDFYAAECPSPLPGLVSSGPVPLGLTRSRNSLLGLK